MCTRYISPEVGDVERHWQVGARDVPAWPRELFPNYAGPFIRAPRRLEGPDAARPAPAGRELVLGQWSLIPWFAKERKLKYPTSNARSEELSQKASYKHPWARGQRCIIPAAAFFEPCWLSGRHVPWLFRRADGLPWGLAGLWNLWTDPASGEQVESYTLLTLNADHHPLMNRMHRPDPQRPPEQQDKRSVVPIEQADVDAWLHAPVAEAAQLLRLAPPECFVAEAVPEAARAPVPKAATAGRASARRSAAGRPIAAALSNNPAQASLLEPAPQHADAPSPGHRPE